MSAVVINCESDDDKRSLSVKVDETRIDKKENKLKLLIKHNAFILFGSFIFA